MSASGDFPHEAFTPDGLLDASFPVNTRTVSLKTGQNISRGDLLGSDGTDYLLSLSAAGDGSEVPTVIAAQDVDATAGSLECVVYTHGRFDERNVTIGTAHTADSVRDALGARGIQLAESVAA